MSLLPEGAALDLGSRLQGMAAHIAESTCEFLLMLGEFDRGDCLRWYAGLKSVAHWASWACSMSAGTAREHVRVARALELMPLTVTEFRAGRLSYSKVREMSRIVGMVDEAELVRMARDMTASQLARTVRSYRSVTGTRVYQEGARNVSWSVREDGMVQLHAILPPELGAEVVTAIERSVDKEVTAENEEHTTRLEADGTAAEAPPESSIGAMRADGLVQLARAYSASQEPDRTGEDRHLVVVQVDAAALASAHVELRDAARGNVPAGTPVAVDPAGPPPRERAGIRGLGPVEALTAERLACTNPVAMVVTAEDGEILHLGRRRRLASPAQRRALRLRDATCQFPGCDQTRHLDAHHLTPWSRGGRTDLDGLVLLCRRHHVHCHEYGLRLIPAGERPTGSTSADHEGRGTAGPRPAGSAGRFTVIDPLGHDVTSTWPRPLERLDRDEHRNIARPRTEHPDRHEAEERIFPLTGGFGFQLAECVGALLAAESTGAVA